VHKSMLTILCLMNHVIGGPIYDLLMSTRIFNLLMIMIRYSNELQNDEANGYMHNLDLLMVSH
jgi:hypothetical protein